jgi:phosphatidate cytidylyltransferase
MLRTRVIVGSLLAALVFGMLLFDTQFAPWYPLLYILVIWTGILACRELLSLLALKVRPHAIVALAGVVFALSCPWFPQVAYRESRIADWAILVLVVSMMIAFFREMAIYQGPGQAVVRIAMTCFIVVYLGIMPCFLIALRWLPGPEESGNRAMSALILAIFVPKCGDIGAYFTGRLLGRHRMTPYLSPKKTWEGAAGAFASAIVIAVIGASMGNRPPAWVPKAVLFGIVIGLLGMLGDLAESLIKRESFQKDASDAVPGFGGILDVIDSVVFSAPVSYLLISNDWVSPL